ncbi:hypothetical protein Ddye_014993 [Dipteronia dyeriana]|uniref:RNase H type-1 domain-containing protein n=1 Tax=Dipteronia dyeriana TaxID=168575 RepID=A0AAD9WXH4_9ROSI|nr:hypothetical protein Ddye_014993 [Dipteronia dyeriana]
MKASQRRSRNTIKGVLDSSKYGVKMRRKLASLCNVIYKAVAKALANRLKGVVGEDRWIARPTTFKGVSSPVLPPGTKLSQHYVRERDGGFVCLIVENAGWYKVNTDAAISNDGIKMGFGIIILNSNGVVMASSVQSLNSRFPHQMAEAMAIFKGLQFAVETGLVPCVMESDAQVVINHLNSVVAPLSDVGLIIQDIFSFCEKSLSCFFNFVPRNGNMVAHYLAKLGLSSWIDNFWMEECPPCVILDVMRDCSRLD